MGLDITAFSKLRYFGHHEVPEGSEHPYDPDTYVRLHVEAYAYDAFPHALLGVPNQQVKEYGSTKFISGGCFELTPETEQHSFRAGSYGGYTRWRKGLAQQFNPYGPGPAPLGSAPAAEGPFYELLWFADNEGTIGQLAAVNLLTAFREHEVAYAAAHDEWDVQTYRNFLTACELAADGGLIDFH